MASSKIVATLLIVCLAVATLRPAAAESRKLLQSQGCVNALNNANILTGTCVPINANVLAQVIGPLVSVLSPLFNQGFYVCKARSDASPSEISQGDTDCTCQIAPTIGLGAINVLGGSSGDQVVYGCNSG